MTVRFPVDLIVDMKAVRRDEESVNDLITHAVESEVRRRRALKALDAIEKLKAESGRRSGVLPGSAEIIRSLRDSEGRRD